MENLIKKAVRMKEILGLDSFPVGVKFCLENVPHGDAQRLAGYRYCQALMAARRGKKVFLDAEGIACPAAAAAFGFKPLPEQLKNGIGLQGFGIVGEPETGKRMFEGMAKLSPGVLKGLLLFPLEKADIKPDVVVVEDEMEKLMWLALAQLNVQGGKRIESNTAILQAACVDATLIPYTEKKFNISLGCYGCRDATDIAPGESVLGFPFEYFDGIMEKLELLSKKAIANSRSKNAFTALKKKAADSVLKNDPFSKSCEKFL